MNYTSGQYHEAGQSALPAGHKGMSWVWQALNAGNDMGGGGLLVCAGAIVTVTVRSSMSDCTLRQAADWTSVDYAKLSYLQPYLSGQFQNHDPAKNLPPANQNVSWVVAMPSPQPTMAPTSPLFSYYHTRGHQIVDQHGRSIRLAGLNW